MIDVAKNSLLPKT